MQQTATRRNELPSSFRSEILMGTPTATLRLTKPTINADGNGAWPADLNLNCDLIDRAMNQVVTVNIADTNVSLEADGTNSDQALYAAYNFTGALTADRTVTLPSCVKIVTIRQHYWRPQRHSKRGRHYAGNRKCRRRFFYCDGTNVTGPALGRGGAAQIPLRSNSGVANTGSNKNDSASAGYVGEFVSGGVASGSAIPYGKQRGGKSNKHFPDRR